MKVLVAIDGSVYSRWGLEWISRMPFVIPLQVTAMHVIDIAALRAPFVVQPVIVGNERYIQEEIRRLEEHGTKAVTEAKKVMAARKLKGRVVKVQGAVAVSILDRAPKRQGLIVVGSRGLDAFDRFMLGSVSTQVTAHAPCSVLVVKTASRQLKRVLLAIDGSAASATAVRFVLSNLAPRTIGPGRTPIQVLLVHVMPYLKYPEVRETGRAIVRRYSGKISQAGFQVKELLRLGKPAHEILQVADQHKADVIVTGARGLGAIGRVLLGSVSTRVVQHSRCSVLVVR